MTVSYRVDRLTRTVEKHGLTRAEIERCSEAVRFMDLHCQRRRALWWVTTEKDTARFTISDIGKRITKLQGTNSLPQYSATIFETRGGQHAHIIFIGNDGIADRLRSSSVFGSIIEVEPVTDPNKLTSGYLAKERTSKAGYGREHVLGGRLKGSHRLEGGGDRVRLSRDLERDGIEAGYVQPWQHTNAQRAEKRKTYRLRNSGPLARAPQPAGQLSLLPKLRPVSRLHNFGGGIVPPAVAAEIEFRRRQLGLSQRQFAGMAGISQGQYANAIRGHDPISPFAVNRLRELRPLSV